MNRPASVYVVAFFMLVSSAIGIFIGLRGLGFPVPGSEALVLDPSTPMFLIVVILSASVLVLSAVGLIVTVGLLLLKGWAWTGAVTIAAIRILPDLIFFMTGGFGLGMIGVYVGIGGALLNLFIIILMLRGSTKEAFGK